MTNYKQSVKIYDKNHTVRMLVITANTPDGLEFERKYLMEKEKDNCEVIIFGRVQLVTTQDIQLGYSYVRFTEVTNSYLDKDEYSDGEIGEVVNKTKDING
jgi:hypothetical protein